MAQSRDWTGAYAGANLGLTTDADSDLASSIHLGYDMQAGRSVTGLELEGSKTDTDVGGENLDSLLRGKVRFGRLVRLVRDDTLLYGVAGIAAADGSSGIETGYLAGLGIEYRTDGPVSLGAEVLHHRFPDFAETGRAETLNTLSARISYRF